MTQENASQEPLFEGIEPDLLRRIGKCLRKHYRTADKAVVYAETVTREYNIVGVTNLRDALSHLSTALDSTKTYEQREQSVKSMEGHIRRAVVESLQLAAEARLTATSKVIEILHATARGQGAKRVPADGVANIDKGLEESLRLYKDARSRKGENIWNREWEDGAELFVRCVNMTKEIEAEASRLIEQASDRDFHLRLSKSGLFWSVVGAVVVSGLFFALGLYVQKLMQG